VGYSVGRSGRSSGWRGAKGPPPVGTADLVVDIAKSVSRAPWSVPATPCVLPNSRLHWRRQQRVLDAHEMAALQGIWPRDFPALESWRKSDKRSLVVRDMAGNAFTSTICTPVLKKKQLCETS
jgi:hypothetical protein